MKRLGHLLVIVVLACLMMGSRGCVTTDTAILPEGPKATELGRAKDEQIKGLVAQVKAEAEARELERLQSSLVAANLETIIFAAQHVDPGLPRNAIEEEAKLGIARSPAPNPEEIIKGKDRVIAILKNDVATAKAAYGKAFDEAKQAKLAIIEKNDEIAQRDGEIVKRDGVITQLTKDAADEKIAHAKDVQDALNKKDKAFTDYKKAEAEKERATWVLWTRIAGLGFIVVGAVIAIMFKIVAEGASLVGVGVTIGLVSIFIDWLTAQIWFPWLCGGTILLALGLGGYALYRMWKKNTLQVKVTAALQDLKDESATLGNNLWSEVEQHLKYRLGDKGGVEQKKLVASMGLINPDQEKR